MKISLLLISTITLIIGVIMTINVKAYAAGKTTPPSDDGINKVVIDAGHGGSDPGTTQCPDMYESKANLIIANKLRSLLENSGIGVYMTRTDDVYMTNEQRYTYANSTDADVLVSIHLNGSTDHSVNGTLGLYSKPKKDKSFATTVHSGMASDLNVPDRGLTNFMSGVILKFNKPATIVEAVYLSNTDECNDIKNGDRTDEIAQAIFNGINRWFTK